MPSARKRTIHEVDGDGDQPKEPSMLYRLRNMWQFANLFQWIMIFGKALKIDDNIDIEDLEAECLKPDSMALREIGLALLKFLSSHRGLTHDLFDEYTRRQYLAKAPGKNPFGDDETPAKFADFDIFTKLRVLHQMTLFVMMNPEKLRERMEEQRDVEQADWRIEPYGWDSKDRTYYVLDDNRIYRMIDAPPPTQPLPKHKKNTQKARAAARAAKRRRISAALDSETDGVGQDDIENGSAAKEEGDGLGGAKWECIAVTLEEVRRFVDSIRKTNDENQRILRDRIQDHLVPILEKQEESRKRKIQQRERELLNLEKMAHAKRSSRIASKLEHERMEEQAREEARKRAEEEAVARKEEQKRLKMERERDNRLMSREKRLREREARRRQHEEELALLSEDSRNPGAGRISGRHLQAAIEKNKRALQELEDEEDDWIFDCVCGAYGQVDDGTHSVACERCNTWQHSKCLGIDEAEADREDFHFICGSCRRREQEPHRPSKIRIKFKGQDHSSSPPTPKTLSATPALPPQRPPSSSKMYVAIPTKTSSVEPSNIPLQLNGSSQSAGMALNGLSSKGDPSPQKASMQASTQASTATIATGDSFTGSSSASGAAQALPTPKGTTNGLAHNPFSSPHPTLSPPDQSPNKSRAYETIFDQTSPMNSAKEGSQVQMSPQRMANGILEISLAPDFPPPTATGRADSHVAGGVSPSKESSGASKAVSPDAPPHGLTPALPSPANNLKSPKQQGSPVLSMATPRFEPGHSQTRYDESSPLIPPSHGGLSPTKHSPPQQTSSSSPNGVNGSKPQTGAILPPVAALSPSPTLQNLTPPVKPQQQHHGTSSVQTQSHAASA
ncbi:Reticulocyte-binding protein 2 a [Pleurostoma richardsiae]|uniref:Reticulocyte-binding protein 2 a n=1 Tax=Pleurostoma richardsiae TaxID=41990 RepID=A0AA38RW07_9PEZI|nr:Reticulocyte-binding protein 2 a [Pleurostoma richardsiae]